MTLIYQVDPPAAANAQTHAFIIGVGRYTHMDNVSQFGLTQLTSPIASAKAFAHWLIETPLTNPAAPLTSVELLLSATEETDNRFTRGNGASIQVDAATYENISYNFGAWAERCNQPHHVAIFYFCGHGLEKEDLALLPEDFAKFGGNPWQTAINFQRTLYGMQTTCKASTQCYFLDTCRQIDFQTFETPDFGGQSLRRGDLNGLTDPPNSLVLFATESGQQAFGERNEPSRFTENLIMALSGGGATHIRTPQQRNWVVDLVHLATGVGQLMQHANETDTSIYQLANPELTGRTIWNSPIHHLPGNPEVKTKILCKPELATATATLELVGRTDNYKRDPNAGAWEVLVEAGSYDLKANFADGAYPAVELNDLWILPPIFEETLKVES